MSDLKPSPIDTAVLLVDCPDRKGLVAAIANLLYTHGANIIHADEHQDRESGWFFMRIEWSLEDFELTREAFASEFQQMAARFAMRWRVKYAADRPTVAVLVSRQQHCLIDLLHSHHAGELPCEIPLIIGNHPDAAPLAHFYGIPFHHIPVSAGTKSEAEAVQRKLLQRHHVELVVLARYMQVLSPDFVAAYPYRIINVHHSFLPAFSGARPYHAAFQRGVKLIGATSHYVTEVLDDGPIIEQDVMRVSHRDELEDLSRKGRDLERVVLSRAVRWHLQHRILHYANKTVVFD